MTRITCFLVFVALALTCLGTNVQLSQETLRNQLDSNEEAAIEFFALLLEDDDLEDEFFDEVCKLVKEKIWDKFESEEVRADSPLFRCWDEDLIDPKKAEKADIKRKPKKPKQTPKSMGTPEKPENTNTHPEKPESPEVPEAPTRTGEKGEAPEAPTREEEEDVGNESPEAPEAPTRSGEAPEAPTREEEEEEEDVESRNEDRSEPEEPENSNEEPEEPENSNEEPEEPENSNEEPEEPENSNEKPQEPENSNEKPEEPENSNEEPEEPENSNETPENTNEEPENTSTAPEAPGAPDVGSIEIYKASFYINNQEEDVDCFSEYDPDTIKADSGLMANLNDICIVLEDGFLWLTFQTEEGSKQLKVLKLGEDSASYSVVYDTTTEDFTISEGNYVDGKYKHTNSHVVESMFLLSVYDLYVSGEAEPYPLQAKWVAQMDETYIVSMKINVKSSQCFTPTQGRLAGTELCAKYPKSGQAELYANNILVFTSSEVVGSSVTVEYQTKDDCVRLYSSTGVLFVTVISTEVLFNAGSGVIAPKGSGETLSASLEFDPDGEVSQFDCINVYNDHSLDYVLYSEVNVLCLFCQNPQDSSVACGIGFYSKEKESSFYSLFQEIDRKLTLVYETSTETIHILYGDEELSFYADEIFFFIETIQEHSLQAIFGLLDGDSLTDSVSVANCQSSSSFVCIVQAGGYDVALTCEEEGCYIGSLDDGEFLGSKFYAGDWDQVQVYSFEDDDTGETYEYCLSFHSNDGDIMNHCLLSEQLHMYTKIMTLFPIYTLS